MSSLWLMIHHKEHEGFSQRHKGFSGQGVILQFSSHSSSSSFIIFGFPICLYASKKYAGISGSFKRKQQQALV